MCVFQVVSAETCGSGFDSLFVAVQGVAAVVAFFFVPRYGSVAGRASPFFVLFFQPLFCFAYLDAIQGRFGVFASVGAELSQVFVFGA